MFFFQALRVLLFGTPYTSFNSDWRKQHINFFTNMSYALSFYKVNLIWKALEPFFTRVRVYVRVKRTEIAIKRSQFSQLF